MSEQGDPVRTADFQADIARFTTLMEKEQETQWQQAELALAMAARYGRKTASMVASEVGVSAGYVRHLIATAKAFPTDGTRAKDLSFSHHRIAAVSKDPQTWIERSIEGGYSVEQLREAIRSSRDRIAQADGARRFEERLLRLVEEYNRDYTSITGFVAKLAFTEPESGADAQPSAA